MANFSRWVDRMSLYIALAAAWTAMLGSLYFSEIKAYVPCDLCWYQRILMYPLAVILAVGISVRDKWIPRIVLSLSILGMGVSAYHYLLEKTDLFPKDTFCTAGASCVTVWINWFGFITIPFLAFAAFAIITIMCVVAIMGGEPRQVGHEGTADRDVAEDADVEEVDEEYNADMERAWPARPWTLVTAVILIVVASFSWLFITGWQDKARADALVAAMESTLPVSSVSGDMSPVTSAFTGTVGSGPSLIANGQALYINSCAACHGPNGEGVAFLGSAIVANVYMAEHSDAEVLAMIKAGRERNDPENTTGLVMPPNGGAPNLTDSDLQAIIAYLRSIE